MEATIVAVIPHETQGPLIKPAGGHRAREFKIERRHKPAHRREAYIMHFGKYLVGCTMLQSPGYEAVVAQLLTELQEGSTLVSDAKARGQLLIEASVREHAVPALCDG